MERGIERTKVQNPFSMGVQPGRPKYQPDLQSRVPSRASFDKAPVSGAYIVDSLVKFAGVAGNEYIKSVHKKVEADKAVQTSLAVQGLAPSDTATTAGYRAHAAVAIKGQTLAAQARLNDIAKQRTTDDEWKEAIREEYRTVDEYLMNNYDNYSTDIELQKLSAVALRETIPQVTAQREASKIDYEIQDRIDSATDVLVNAAASGTLSKSNPKEMVELVDGMVKSLKLTASQKDKVIEDAIIQSKNPDLIKLAKSYKGDRNTSLYSRSGKVQLLDKRAQAQAIADNGINLAKEKDLLLSSYLTGSMTEKEFTVRVNNRNRVLDNKFMTPSQYTSALNKFNKIASTRFVVSAAMKDIQNPDVTELDHKPKVIQAAYDEILKIREESALERAKEQGLSEKDTKDFIEQERVQTIAYVGDQSVKGDVLLGSWKADLHHLATLNIPANFLEGDVKGYTVEDLPEKAQKAIKVLDYLTPISRAEYLDNLDDGDAKTLRNFMHLRDMGLPLTQALDRAQFLTAHPKPIDFKAITKGIEEVRENQEYYWWRKDIPDNQSAYMDQVLREKIMIDPEPASESNIEMVSNWMSKSWTTLKNGTRIQGSADHLSKAAKLHPSRLGAAMQGYIDAEKDRILPLIDGLGLDMSDVFPVTDPKTDTMQLRTKFGVIIGSTRRLSDLPKYAAQRKVRLEKAASDKYNDFMTRQTGGILYGKRYPARRD